MPDLILYGKEEKENDTGHSAVHHHLVTRRGFTPARNMVTPSGRSEADSFTLLMTTEITVTVEDEDGAWSDERTIEVDEHDIPTDIEGDVLWGLIDWNQVIRRSWSDLEE